MDGTDEQARALALTRLDQQVRPPFVRHRHQWGPLTLTTWGQPDGGDHSWTDSAGFLPFQPPGTQHSEVPAAHLDPPPAD